MAEDFIIPGGTPGVRYRDVRGFPGYRVGTDGSVWSCRTRRGPLSDQWHQLPLTRRKGQGYVTACFRKGRKNHVRYVHRLVLEAFVGACPRGMVGCHNDGNPANNHVENLRWDTPESNQADKQRHGTIRRGVEHPSAKKTEDLVLAIHALAEDGWPHPRIAALFGMGQAEVSAIVRGDKWAHLHPERMEPDGMQALVNAGKL